jgi:hypothetical protein
MSHVSMHRGVGPPPFPLDPAFLAALRHQGEVYREAHGGELPSTRDWEYLERRCELDPTRFIRFHPVIGRWIADDPGLRPAEPSSPPPIVVVPPPSSPPPTGSQTILPPPAGGGGTTMAAVPEPAAWVLLGVGIGIVAVYLAFRGPRR